MTLGLFIRGMAGDMQNWDPRDENLTQYALVERSGNDSQRKSYARAVDSLVQNDWDLKPGLNLGGFFNKYFHEETGLTVVSFISRDPQDPMQVAIYGPEDKNQKHAADVLKQSIIMGMDALDYDGRTSADKADAAVCEYLKNSAMARLSTSYGAMTDSVADVVSVTFAEVQSSVATGIKNSQGAYRRMLGVVGEALRHTSDTLYGKAQGAATNLASKLLNVKDWVMTPREIREFEREMALDMKIRGFMGQSYVEETMGEAHSYCPVLTEYGKALVTAVHRPKELTAEQERVLNDVESGDVPPNYFVAAEKTPAFGNTFPAELVAGIDAQRELFASEAETQQERAESVLTVGEDAFTPGTVPEVVTKPSGTQVVHYVPLPPFDEMSESN